MTTTWHDLEHADPDLAEQARARFEATGLGLIATLRADGSPRISGIETLIAHGDLWLGMMPESRKSQDLRRDPRFALHNATVDKEVKEGDVRVSGRAVLVDPDTPAVDDFLAAFEVATGYRPPPGPFDLWRADIGEVSTIEPGGDHLVIRVWHPGEATRVIERY